ncbi:MAG: rhodanese-like domain-containing protein [Spirochaetota bacterium]|nr:rhodanese-like domain-containing protein [Spirochaetota bacterium]
MIEVKELKKAIKESTYIVIISVIIGFAVNLLHPNGFILISKEEYNNKRIVLISSEEAQIKHTGSTGIFIDSRSKEEYYDAHINGAIHIPAEPESTSMQKIKANLSILKQQKEPVIYCSGTSCGTSEILAKRLMQMGFSRHIYIIKHGFPEWRSEGYPVEYDTTEEIIRYDHDKK